MQTLYLIRHAVPENDDRSFHVSAFQRDMLGIEDHSLSGRGRQQAALLGRALGPLGIDVLHSSSMHRARETADIAAEVGSIRRGLALDDLIELAPGQPDRPALWARAIILLLGSKILRRIFGKALGPLLGLYHLQCWMKGTSTNGEPQQAVAERLERGLAAVENSDDRTVAIVCHGFVIIWLAHRFSGSWRFFFPPRMNNCSVTRFDRGEHGKWILHSFARAPARL